MPAAGREEGGAVGRAGAGVGTSGSIGADMGVTADGVPNSDMVLWSWEVGARAAAAAVGFNAGAGVRMRV